MSLSENINLPPTLLSRFDLVYLVLDKRDEDKDRRLAKHLVSLFWADAPEAAQPVRQHSCGNGSTWLPW